MSEKIAVIMPEIFSALDYEFLDGIYRQAKLSGTDVLVFTGVKNSNGDFYDNAYIQGLRNIYELVRTASIDGIIFSPGKFHDRQIADDINKMIISTGKPCIITGAESEYFPYMFADQTEYVQEITQHLIECHNCRKLYFLSGIKGEYNSEERRKGFEAALSEAGIPFDESYILYGYFWKVEPYRIAADIAAGKIEKPDAIVCANDSMAVALCSALAENGIKVPDDIKITGYDGEYSIVSHMPSLTTVVGNEERLGRDAFRKLYYMITGKDTEKSPDTGKLRFGTSCGCNARAFENGDKLLSYIGNVVDHFVEQGLYIGTDIAERMSNVNSLEELVERIHSFSYMISGWKSLDICLCDDWKYNPENPSVYRKKGYSERMISIVSDIFAGENNTESEILLIDDFIISMNQPHEPLLYVFTSLHSGQQIFGYITTAYSSAYDIYMAEHYINWCDALSNGLRVVQEKMHFEYVRQQIEMLSGIKQLSEEYGSFNYSKHLNALRKQIYTEPQRNWNIDEMQKQIGISRSHLQRLYKSMFSVSCTDDVINARIIKACQLLKNTDISVREIASQCGYNDESHFMRQFKKRTGITALQFRKNKTDMI